VDISLEVSLVLIGLMDFMKEFGD